VLKEARADINASGWQPSMAFPEDDDQREALAKVIENTLLFGDILLKMPDMTHEVCKSTSSPTSQHKCNNYFKQVHCPDFQESSSTTRSDCLVCQAMQ
jgi:hypothetical protein